MSLCYFVIQFASACDKLYKIYNTDYYIIDLHML